MKQKYKWLLALLILAGVLIYIQFSKDRIINKSQMRKLPKLLLTDITGKKVTEDDFEGKITYIQFVNPKDISDVELMNNVYSEWHNENIIMLFILKDSSKIKLKINPADKNVIVAEKEYEELKVIFKTPMSYGMYYLFNKDGIIYTTGSNDIAYKDGIRVALNELVKNKYFSISSFIRSENIHNIKWFHQVADKVRNGEKKYYLISLFANICDSCFSGRIIDRLNNTYDKKNDLFYIAVILNNNHTENDAQNLRLIFQLKYPVIIADLELSNRWNYLISEFRESFLSDILLVIDDNGVILDVFYPGCNCYENFTDFIEKLE